MARTQFGLEQWSRSRSRSMCSWAQARAFSKCCGKLAWRRPPVTAGATCYCLNGYHVVRNALCDTFYV